MRAEDERERAISNQNVMSKGKRKRVRQRFKKSHLERTHVQRMEKATKKAVDGMSGRDKNRKKYRQNGSEKWKERLRLSETWNERV